MTYSTTITSKGQITLPAEFRKQLELVPGRKVEITRHGDHLIIEAPVNIDEIRAKNRRHIAQLGLAPIREDEIDEIVQGATIEKYDWNRS